MMRLPIRERVRRKALAGDGCRCILRPRSRGNVGTAYELDLPPTFRVAQSEMKEARLRVGIQLGTYAQLRTCLLYTSDAADE